MATLIIAEAGVNHNGSLIKAKELINIAASAGADAIKFQTFKTEKLVTVNSPKAAYQKVTTDEQESQFDMLKRLELDGETHYILRECCRENGIEFLSTPFDTESLNLLVHQLKLKRIKVSSGDINNGPMLLQAAQTGVDVIVSTGMATIGEIEMALAVLAFGYLKSDKAPSVSGFYEAYWSEEGQRLLQQKVSLLHCTSAYPAKAAEVNLAVINTLKAAFGLPVGYSDHTEGIAIPIAAVGCGAVILEKHFTLSRDLPGPDHVSSLEPEELAGMVRAIREVDQALGKPTKKIGCTEVANRNIARKSLVATKNVVKGELFSTDNLGIKRPGYGISPMQYWEYVGKIAPRDLLPDEVIK